MLIEVLADLQQINNPDEKICDMLLCIQEDRLEQIELNILATTTQPTTTTFQTATTISKVLKEIITVPEKKKFVLFLCFSYLQIRIFLNL